jgi:hypothetical protein
LARQAQHQRSTKAEVKGTAARASIRYPGLFFAEEVESRGWMPLMLQNYLDKQQSMNLTAQALVKSGTAVLAASNLHR